ncbi:hypothetical protein B0J13DRAFT_243223 [Dactylonectria estremocensis]|uniref:Uncharacterized protein n=1 Tax=Dactylonectria estremocensis TaxID=1079267 RepID=A0A9P9I9V2_9HYPO|nr:hypothetical protein B0J13DRAFT_243223 [Dactylonectria estremocensis]
MIVPSHQLNVNPFNESVQLINSTRGRRLLSQFTQYRSSVELVELFGSLTSTGLVAVTEEDNIALNTDHSGLVKYDSRSQGDYTIVRERLRRLVDEARLEVAKRFAEHTPVGDNESLSEITGL